MEVRAWVLERWLLASLDRRIRVRRSEPVRMRALGSTWWTVATTIGDPDDETCRQATSGYGTARSPALARLKSLAEALERKTLADRGLAFPGGVALGVGEKAAERAYSELVERDAYLRWALGETRAKGLPSETHSTAHAQPTDGIQLFVLPASDPRVTVVLAADLSRECVPFGLGAGRDPREAAERATEETIASQIRHIHGECRPHSSGDWYGIAHSRTRNPVFRERLLLEARRQATPWSRARSARPPRLEKLPVALARDSRGFGWQLAIAHADSFWRNWEPTLFARCALATG